MSPLLYWVLVIVLVSLLIILSGYLILNISWNVCVHKSERKAEPHEAGEENKLKKYHFDKYDVEDLTRIEGNFTSIIPNVTIINEVKEGNIRGILKKSGNNHTSKNNCDEASTIPNDNETSSKCEKLTSTFQSIDDLEFWDPQYIDLLKTIMKVENRARQIEEEISNHEGNLEDLKYYEMNERYIHLMIALSEVFCERDDLRKRNLEVMDYIEGCKQNLKNRYHTQRL